MVDLYIPGGANLAEKRRDGLWPGSIVLVYGTGRGKRMTSGGEVPLAGLVIRVHPDDATARAANGEEVRWPGTRPFIDCVVVIDVAEVEGGDPGAARVELVTSIPWRKDVERLAQGWAHGQGVTYQVVAEIRGAD